MKRPLYRFSATPEMDPCPPNGHMGLWYDKFCNTWDSARGVWSLKSRRADLSQKESGSEDGANPKVQWLQSVVGKDTSSAVGNGKQCEELVYRVINLVETQKGQWGIFETDGPFVTGMGRNHPVENGFVWHSTLGVPYLPGSSIKGMLRGAAVEFRPGQHNSISRFLGAPNQVGCVDILDAIPVRPVKVAIDVITSHYGGWDEQNPPGDWRSPNPIPFLVTTTGNQLLFSIVPRCLDISVDGIFEYLTTALLTCGAGAKTSNGYGRFRLREDTTNEWRKKHESRQREATERKRSQEMSRTPEGRWELEMQGRSEEDVLDLIRIKIQDETFMGEESLGFAKAVEKKNWLGKWKKGESNTNIQLGAKKLKERAQWIERLLSNQPNRRS